MVKSQPRLPQPELQSQQSASETMAVSTATEAGSSEVSQLGSRIETFAVPGTRTVHGKTFPLGIRPKEDQEFENAESAVAYLKELSEKGVFDSLITQRKTALSIVAALTCIKSCRWSNPVPQLPNRQCKRLFVLRPWLQLASAS
jgi:hypothetical protein